MEKLISMKPSQSQCREPRLTLADLIDEWLPKLTVNAGAALDAKTQAVYRAIWLEGLGDLSPEVLRAALQKTLRECAYWPVKVADIRKHVTAAESSAVNIATEQAWQRVLKLRCLYWNPDMPGGFSRGTPKLSERVQHAARAAGVFREVSHPDQLHVWGKKKFIESFIAWGELEQDKFLLPDGELKNLLAGAAEAKALPAASVDWNELHARGLAYAEEHKTSPTEDPNIKRALREIRQRAYAASSRSLEEQKRILRERGFLPKLQSVEVPA